LAYASWAFEEFEEPEIVSLDSITGTFALEDIELTYGHYWVTVAMDRVGELSVPESTNQPFVRRDPRSTIPSFRDNL
jgi:hypothetical protein